MGGGGWHGQGRAAVGLTFNAGECSGGGRDWRWARMGMDGGRVVTDADGHGRGWARMGEGDGCGW